MPDALQIPDGIGPHEGQELELMLQGRKPLAFFSDTVPASVQLPEGDFKPYVDSGHFSCVEKIYRFPKNTKVIIRHLYYACRDEAWRIEELMRIHDASLLEGQKITDDDERKTGYLLGYTEEQVSAFLEWQKKCGNL